VGQLERTRPQGIKAHVDFAAFCGTTEVVPQKAGVYPQPVQPLSFQLIHYPNFQQYFWLAS
jgi:hypothetical protein